MYSNIINVENNQTRFVNYARFAHMQGLKLDNPCHIYMLHVYVADIKIAHNLYDVKGSLSQNT
jgi:hypothetical protein